MLKPYPELMHLPDALQILYKDPTEEQLLIEGFTMTKLIELAELGKYQCFGEDWSHVSNFMLSTNQLAMLPIGYSTISTMPTECFAI